MSTQEKLFQAISKGNLNQIRLALLKGADLEALDGKGRTALICAACQTQKSLEMVQLLLEKGANINAVCKTFGITALEHAMTGRPRLIETACFLLDAGPELNHISNLEKGVTIGQKLMHACFYDATLFPCFEKLLHLNIIPINIDDYSPLEAIIRSSSSSVNQENPNHLKMFSSLIEKYPELVNQQNDSGCTPLHIACWMKNKKAVELLLNMDADLKKVTLSYKQSAMDIAWRDKEFGAWFLAETEKRVLSKSVSFSFKNSLSLNRL